MQKKSATTMVLLSAGLFLLLATGCGEEEGPDCSTVANPCEALSALQCSSDSTAIEECQENEDGCFEWATLTECETGMQCDDSGAEPVCACTNACSPAGATRCQGTTIIQECREDTNGCRDWVETQDCADTSQVCDASGGTATCVAGCTNECVNEGSTECDGTVIRTCTMGTDGCLDWVAGTDCADTGETCDVVSGTAQCVCVDACTPEHATQCNGTVIEACEAGTDGCLAWTAGIDCDDTGELCAVNSTTGVAECVPCIDDCTTEDETQCSGTVIQTCTENTDGCLVWMDGQDCAVFGLTCDDSAEPAVCPTGTGESCADVEVIMAVPYTKTGTDFTADYGDDIAFTDSSCESRTSGQADAVFALDLQAGQQVVVQELGGLDAVVSIQSTCGNDAACLVSDDFGTDDGPARYNATTDERVYIIIEAWYDSPSTTDYEISVDIGVPDPYKGYWQEFDSTDAVDVTGHSITFTPAPADANLYTWAEASGVTAFPETPGGGTATTTLSLTDSDNSEYTLTAATSFSFFEVAYTSLFVGSNGFITFGAGRSYHDYDELDFFDYPRIAGFDEDLNPAAGGTITVDEYSDRIVVTFEGVPYYYVTTELVSFQIVMNGTTHATDPGVIAIYYTDVQTTDRGMIGISSGVGDGTYPAETDFIAP